MCVILAANTAHECVGKKESRLLYLFVYILYRCASQQNYNFPDHDFIMYTEMKDDKAPQISKATNGGTHWRHPDAKSIYWLCGCFPSSNFERWRFHSTRFSRNPHPCQASSFSIIWITNKGPIVCIKLDPEEFTMIWTPQTNIDWTSSS